MGLSMGTGAALSGVGSLAGGLFGKNSATDAARIQANAARNASNLQALGFQYTAGQLSPFVNGGVNNLINPYFASTADLYNAGNQRLQPLTSRLDQYANMMPNSPYTTGLTIPGVNVNTNPLQTGLTTPDNVYAAPITTQQGVANWGLGADQQKALEQTPGYQFTKQQGLQGVQNAAAASGRGVSGNALAGAANYATGLANNTFNQQYQNMLQGQQQAFNQNIGAGQFNLGAQQQRFNQGLASNDQLLRSLQQQFGQELAGGNYTLQAQNQGWQQALGLPTALAGLEAQQFGQQHGLTYDPLQAMLQGLGLSENAAAMVGNNATNAANNIGNYLTQGANAQASGIIGANNALTGGLGGAGNSLMNYLLFNQLFGGGGGGNTNYDAFNAQPFMGGGDF